MYLPLIAVLAMPCLLTIVVFSLAGDGDADDSRFAYGRPVRRLADL